MNTKQTNDNLNPPLAEAPGSEPWRPMKIAPHNATDVQVKMRDGSVQVAHWASDLSGEEQPPFEGWFVARKDYMLGIEPPVAWRPLPNNEVRHAGPDASK